MNADRGCVLCTVILYAGWFWNLEFSKVGSLEGEGNVFLGKCYVEEGIWQGVGVIGMINVRNGSYSGII